VDPDPDVGDLVRAAVDFLDAEPGRRHGLAASLPELAFGKRVEVAATDRGVVVVVQPSLDDWAEVLTPRERDVAAAVARGLSNPQIAAELYVSVATVKDHVHHILAKTGLANRAAIAARWAGTAGPSR
jgi:DNA-binding NarL/FixJ family response regulator